MRVWGGAGRTPGTGSHPREGGGTGPGSSPPARGPTRLLSSAARPVPGSPVPGSLVPGSPAPFAPVRGVPGAEDSPRPSVVSIEVSVEPEAPAGPGVPGGACWAPDSSSRTGQGTMPSVAAGVLYWATSSRQVASSSRASPAIASVHPSLPPGAAVGADELQAPRED